MYTKETIASWWHGLETSAGVDHLVTPLPAPPLPAPPLPALPITHCPASETTLGRQETHSSCGRTVHGKEGEIMRLGLQKVQGEGTNQYHPPLPLPRSPHPPLYTHTARHTCREQGRGGGRVFTFNGECVLCGHLRIEFCIVTQHVRKRKRLLFAKFSRSQSFQSTGLESKRSWINQRPGKPKLLLAGRMISILSRYRHICALTTTV